MKAHKFISENLLYGLAFFLALGLRLYQLGAGPLSDLEAGWALQALGLARGQASSLGAQPAYILLTSQLLSILGDTNFLARILPALAGSLIVWIPFLYKDWMGDSAWFHRAGLIMAFGLAIDPGLVSLSRQAGSLMPAMAFTLLGLACFHKRHMLLSGIFAGLALLSGPAFLQGALILGISWGLIRLARFRVIQPQPVEQNTELPAQPAPSRSIGLALVAFLATILVAGTLFMRIPQGLGALAQTIPAYLDAWIIPSGIPVLRLPASLLVYQPLLLLFGMIGAVHVWFSNQDDQPTRQIVAGLSIWAVVALVLPLLYAGRQVGDMAWALIPLWAITSIEISRLWITSHEDNLTRLVAAGFAALLFVLAVVSWINLLAIGRYQVNVIFYWAIILVAFVLGIIAMLLVAAAYSTSAARWGVVLALCAVLGLWMLSNTWGMSITRHNGAQELWPGLPATGQADQLSLTLADLSSWNTGLKDQLEIVSLVDSPALEWELRHFPGAHFEDTLSPVDSPPVVITLKAAEPPGLAEKYRGQDFNWRQYPGWQAVFPPNIINWLAFRQPPLIQDQIILWARSDIFPGGTISNSGSTAP